jgi:DMSO reductase anchor subunit
MGGSFNTREFFHGRTPATVRLMRVTFLALVFVLPALILALVLAGGAGPATLVGAAAAQLVGMLAERWSFFAEAHHPQNLYYQAVA